MEKSNAQLKEFLSTLDRGQAKRARTLIAWACKVPTRRIYNWTNVGTKITPLEKETIEKTLHKEIFV